jgi:hypothetical protein
VWPVSALTGLAGRQAGRARREVRRAGRRGSLFGRSYGKSGVSGATPFLGCVGDDSRVSVLLDGRLQMS